MSTFDQYATKYQSIRMRREDGILEMRFHTDDGPLQCLSVIRGAFLAKTPPESPENVAPKGMPSQSKKRRKRTRKVA